MSEHVTTNQWGIDEAFKTLESLTEGSSAAKGAMRFLRGELSEARRENVRWENAHKILLSENDRLRRPVHEREPPHCASCACGMDPPQPDAIRAIWNKAVIVQDGNRATVAFETADEAEAAFDYIHQLGSIAQTTVGAPK